MSFIRYLHLYKYLLIIQFYFLKNFIFGYERVSRENREEKDRGQDNIRTWKQRLLEPPAKATLTCDWASIPTHDVKEWNCIFVCQQT